MFSPLLAWGHISIIELSLSVTSDLLVWFDYYDVSILRKWVYMNLIYRTDRFVKFVIRQNIVYISPMQGKLAVCELSGLWTFMHHLGILHIKYFRDFIICLTAKSHKIQSVLNCKFNAVFHSGLCFLTTNITNKCCQVININCRPVHKKSFRRCSFDHTKGPKDQA